MPGGQPLLTEEETRQIEEEIRAYPDKRACCVDALKVVQTHRGWVADEQIEDLAPLLGMTVDELESVASFYPFIFRKPVGRHVVYVCDGLACWVMGYERVVETLTRRLEVSWGGTTGDGRFTLLPASCIGECDHAPALKIDNDVHRGVSPEMIEGILSKYK